MESIGIASRPNEQQLERRRRRTAEMLGFHDEILLIGAGSPIPVPGGLDRVHPFTPHPHYLWLTGHTRGGGVLAYDAAENSWTDFVPPTSDAERIWEGAGDAPGTPLDLLTSWLRERADRRAALLGTPSALIEAVLPQADLTESADFAILAARRIKDDAELSTIQAAVRATAMGFEAARETIARPHATERLIQIELEAACFRAGGDSMGYDTIVGVGGNAAVLHFAPGDRPVAPGDAILIDAGCSIGGYTADVTRTFGRAPLSPRLAQIHAIVLDAERFGVSRCVPGQEWRELHLLVAERLAAGLVHLGILKGEPAGLVEQDAHAVFFPHGLGHLVGLGVRDASGYLPGRARSERFGLASLRMDLPLEAGMVTTVEPGLYFIPRLLRDLALRERHANAIDFEAAEAWIGLGGVRIEDNIHVTESGPVNMTETVPHVLEAK